ncbi:hypothetical protein E2C01_040306 [Portunus trituberculatus]|uniref:Uncharacterized protein n=1 Tax=Portunus trituberculatus TaxID=210409 RepID=A0A5B7FQF5_PORTR|nr:hypothetical protein [Portunus trituberculatus]
MWGIKIVKTVATNLLTSIDFSNVNKSNRTHISG